MNSLYKLQNGTDIRGVACKDDNSSLDVTFSKKEVEIISKGFATWLLDKYKKGGIKIAVGMDSRITGDDFKGICIETLKNLGFEVFDCHMATTPAMFMTTVMDEYNCDGSIMFTASHMPYIYNGMKMFTKDGGLNKEDLKDILDICVSKNFIKDNVQGSVETRDLISDYSKVLVKKIRQGVNSKKNFEKPLSNMKIIVDAGNGAGGFFANKVLEELGADTSGSQFLDPDGMFPNHIPNPEDKEAMKSISEAVIKNKADLGIIFDTDVDRAAIVDKKGNSINKNALIALISKIVLEEYPKSTIVTDSVTSDGLAEFIAENNGIHHRFKRGYKNVINEAIRLNNLGQESHLAIETSGHAALKENYFLDDGAYLISKILIKVAAMNEQDKEVSDVISSLKEATEDKEVRLKILADDFKEYANKLISDLEKFVDTKKDFTKVENNYEGIRVNSESERGWFLLRSSLHEPLIVINFETDREGGCERLYSELVQFLKNYKLEI